MARARNRISRNREWALRAADLYDHGKTDAKVAAVLSDEFGVKLSAKTARSFRLREYEPVADQRLSRIDEAQQVQMLMGAAKDSSIDFAEGANDLLARMYYKLLKSDALDADDLGDVSRSIKGIMKVQLDREKLEFQKQLKLVENQAAYLAKDETIDSATREQRIREIFNRG